MTKDSEKAATATKKQEKFQIDKKVVLKLAAQHYRTSDLPLEQVVNVYREFL